MDDTKYTLSEHLDELRKRIIYCLISVGLLSLASWFLTPHIIKFISSYIPKLVFLKPTEAFFTYLKISMWSGFFLSLPVIFYNVWKFIDIGLTDRERKQIILFAPFSFLLFLIGAFFSFFFVIPLAVKFLIGFGQGFAEPMLSLNEYVSFVGWMTLAFGISFELPIVLLFLSKLKIVSVNSLKTYRKHAVVLIFISAAILTPTPDAFTQLLLAVPLIALYEIGIFISSFV